MAPYPTGWDDVDFALALQQYDLSRMQPHFPGYPIYILTAHLFYVWLHDPYYALTVLSAAAGGLTALPLWLLFSQAASIRVARLAVWIYAIAPLPLISGIQPMSDSLGALLAAWLAYLTWQAVAADRGGENKVSSFVYLTLAGVILGLLLGVRISYLALSSLWIWAVWQVAVKSAQPIRQRMRAVASSAVAALGICLAWLTAMAVSEGGVDSFLALAFSFTEGHFTDWGGVYQAGTSFWERLRIFVFRQLGAAGLGTVWTDAGGWRWLPTAILLLSLFGWMRAGRLLVGRHMIARRLVDGRFLIFLSIWVIPYLLWAFFAQNIEKPRHILPILPPLVLLAAGGIEQAAKAVPRLNSRMFAAMSVAWLLGTAGVTFPILQEAHSLPSPMMQMAEYVKANISASDSLIFTWEEQRVLNQVTPSHTVIRLRRWEDFQTEVLQYAPLSADQPPVRVYATNALLDGFHRPVDGLFQHMITFQGSPWLYPTYHTIALYRATPALYEHVQKGKGETTWKSKRY